ncbi:hypothetical protein PRZ48_005089 [Zasmidium cellare]|uniref:Uncharacterized protein n=1 Tax=Zasmidium cellare TaxID=395010 RepID=A0ABR0ETK5_ZASCE|nr:hypothetical protein PRZ48_005089 [Zasmidium cellare]
MEPISKWHARGYLIAGPALALAGVCAFTGIFFGLRSAPRDIYHQFGDIDAGTTPLSCDGSGNPTFPVLQTSNTICDPHLFLSITLGFGHFTFAEAKILDFAWDVIVGSGGQAFLIWLLYPLFRKLLLVELERRSVTLPIYTAMACSKISFETVWSILRNKRLERTTPASSKVQTPLLQMGKSDEEHSKQGRASWRSQYFLPCIVLSFTYLLAFSKMMSLMTGYQAISVPVIRPQNNSDFFTATEVSIPYAAVRDGSRVNLTDNYLLFNGNGDFYQNMEALDNYAFAVQELQSTSPEHPLTLNTPSGLHDKYLYCMSVDDTQCTFRTSSPSRSTFDPNRTASSIVLSHNGTLSTFHLDPPILDVRVWFLYSSYLEFAPDGMNTMVKVQNRSMTFNEVLQQSQCLPSNSYKWGFSAMLLFTFCILTAVVLVIVQALCAHAYKSSDLAHVRCHVSIYQDILDIGRELSLSTSENGKELDESIDRQMPTVQLDSTGISQDSLDSDLQRGETLPSGYWDKGRPAREKSDGSERDGLVEGESDNRNGSAPRSKRLRWLLIANGR